MMNIENYKKKLESMSREELLHEISNLISDNGIQLQNKCNEIQELKSALARADLQLQFQIGEVDLRDTEIESLKGKRKPEDNEILNILDKLSEIAYKEDCANDILKVVNYINGQNAEIERLTEQSCRWENACGEKIKKISELINVIENLGDVNDELQDQIFELQKQVGEWKTECQELHDECEGCFAKAKEIQRKAVKDTAPLAIQRFINQLDIDEIIRVDSDLGKELLKEKEFVLKRYYGVRVE